MQIIISCPVSKNCRIEQLPTTGAFPRIKGTDKIIKFLDEHSAFAARTMHIDSSPNAKYKNNAGWFTSFVPRALPVFIFNYLKKILTIIRLLEIFF